MKAAVYVGTRSCYDHMLWSAKSLLVNSDVDRIYFLIEDDFYPHKLPECIQSINVSGQQFFPPGSANYDCPWTYMTLLRAVLPYIFPDLDRILALDNDTVMLQDVSDIWDLPIDDYYYAAAKEPMKSKGGCWYMCGHYGQGGVVLHNLKKQREDGLTDQLIDELRAIKYQYAEQDCMNLMCQGKIYPLPSDYCVCNYTERSDNPKIIHYAAVPNEIWTKEPIVQQYREMPMEEIRCTS